MGDHDGEEQQSTIETPSPYDQQINRIREYVTHGLAIAIVLATLFAGLWSFWFVGDPEMEDAKAVAAFMSGLSGAIIGYYFGRGPAEAHATRVQQQNKQTQDKMQQMKEKMGTAKGTIDAHIARGVPVAPGDLRIVSEELSSASN